MIINRLKLKNFKGFEELSVEFHPHFNVVIGINRSGKTSLLEGLRIGLGSFFLGIDEQEVRSPESGIMTFILLPTSIVGNFSFLSA